MTTRAPNHELDPSSGHSLDRGAYNCSSVSLLGDHKGLEAAWRKLGEIGASPTEQYDWARTCAAMNGTYVRRPLAVTVNRGEELVAVAPMDVKPVNGICRRVMLGVDLLHEPADILAADPQALDEIAHVLAKDPAPISFGRLPADSPSTTALRSAFARRALILVRPRSSYPYLELNESWTKPEQHLKARRRSDLRRARRRADKLGNITSEVLTPAPEELAPLLDEVFDVEARSWKKEAGTAMACGSVEGVFFSKYAHAACLRGDLRLAFLRLDGQPIAVQLAVVQGGRFWLLKIGYDAQFASCSPGNLLMREAIAYAAKSRLAGFEFLGGNEPWIKPWTRLERASIAMRVYPHSLQGMAALAADTAANVVNRARQKSAQWAARTRSWTKACVKGLISRASRNYIAGDTLADANTVRQRLLRDGLTATIGYWNSDQQPPREIAEEYTTALDLLGTDQQETYLSIKLPPLQFSQKLLRNVAARAASVDRRIHFDALEPEAVDRTRVMVEDILTAYPSLDIGFTLPGRWRRSLDDALWACEKNLYVRVVKGEWPDPDDPEREMRSGYLEVIEKLAGRARHVSIATHDPGLAAEAATLLKEAGTSCNLELLYGLPMRESLKRARDLGLDVRVYLPYGEAYRPYALSQARRKPWLLWWLAKDLVASTIKA
jgi:CelD/BcsL family acetyltransferase involved in cellulose biosynthesis